MLLKRLRIQTLTQHSHSIENILRGMPNLKALTLIGNRINDMMDADRWANFIRCSLIDLIDFQFQFSFSDTEKNILSKFERFKSDFWTKEHQWPVRCVYSTSSFLMHTIPYPSNDYTVRLSTEYYASELINSESIFDRVTDLSILYEGMQTPCHSYFPNVKILRITNDESRSRYNEPSYTLDNNHIESLK